MKLVFSSDHGGFEMKKLLIEYAKGLGHEVIDAGCDTPEAVDYPDFAYKACRIMLNGGADRAILICGTGIGMSLSANKMRGVRCSMCSDATSARLTREHNDANALALGARVIGPELAKDVLRAWLDAEFIGEYHSRRVKKIMALQDIDPLDPEINPGEIMIDE